MPKKQIHILLQGPLWLSPESNFNVFKYRNLITFLSKTGTESEPAQEQWSGPGQAGRLVAGPL